MRLIVICCLLFLLGGCQASHKGYVIKGDFEGAPEGEWVFLMDPDQRVYYDSVQFKNGHFEFKGEVENPELRSITFFKDPSQRIYGWANILVVPLYVENAMIQVSLPFSELPSKQDKKIPVRLRIEGSKSNELYTMYRKSVTPYILKNDSLFDAYRHAYYYKKGTEEDVFRCVSEMDKMRNHIFVQGSDFIRQHSTSPVALHVAQKLSVRFFDRARAQEVADYLPEEVKATPEGEKAVKALLGRPLYVGDPLPDFDVLGTDLQRTKLSALLQGNYTLVELWASWCGPCRSDIPHLKETYERYHKCGFDIISISIDDDNEAWLKAVNEENMPWTQVLGANGESYKKECMKLFGVSGVPSCVFIDKEGKVLSNNARGGWLNKILAELFDE